MPAMELPDGINAERIKLVMLCDALPARKEDYFYSSRNSPYAANTLLAFRNAGIDVSGITEITRLGIYLTTAVKTPRHGLTVPLNIMKQYSNELEKELSLFPNLKAILLMGDTAIKAINIIAVRNTKAKAIPSGSTYKIRNSEFFYHEIRLYPSYLQTGRNFLIEKAKQRMVAEDIRNAMRLAGIKQP